MKNINLDDARILKNTNLDADESAFLTRQLTYVRKKALQVKKAPLNAFTVFPVMTDVPAGAETAVQRIYDSVGMAEVISNYGDDLKRVDLVAKENAVRVVTVGDAYGYSYKELRSAMFSNMNLDAMKASAARRGIDAKLNRIAWHGDSAHNVIGFLNNDNITAFSLPADGTSNATELSKKTEENVIRDMNDFIESIPEQTKQVEQANTVLLAPKAYNHLATTRLKDSDRTILEFLQGVHPEATLALEALYTTKSGSKFSSSSAEGLMNMFVTKCACQATSTMKRIAIRVSLFAPQNASTTNSLLLDSSFRASSFTEFHASCVAGWLSFLYSSEVHQTVSLEFSSITMNLSLGERPV